MHRISFFLFFRYQAGFKEISTQNGPCASSSDLLVTKARNMKVSELI